MDKNEVQIYNAQPVAQSNRFADEGFDLVVDMTTAKTQFTSMVATTADEKAKLFNAMNNPDFRIADCINNILSLYHAKL